MSPDQLRLLKEELTQDEGCKRYIYLDTRGFPTCGIGHLITKHDQEYARPVASPVTEARVIELFEQDVSLAIGQLFANLSWAQHQPDVVVRALVNMTFQLGIHGVMQFKNTLAYIESGDYEKAYQNGKLSKWYTQTPNRAECVLTMIRNAKP